MRKKTQLSSFDIKVLCTELKTMLVGGFINKIYQPTKGEVLIRINKPVNQPNTTTQAPQDSRENSTSDDKKDITEQNTAQNIISGSRYKQMNVFIKLGKYLYAQEKPKESESDYTTVTSKILAPRPYAMLLRKHLKNGRITDIYQHEFDRIIIMEIFKKEAYQLIIELFGDGNVILVLANKIVQPLFSQSWSYRSIRAGEEFKFPPTRMNPMKITKDEFHKLLFESKKDLVRTLVMDLDVPGIYAEELCLRVTVDKNIKANQVDEKLGEEIFENLRTIISIVQTNPEALFIFENEEQTELIDLVPFKLEKYKDNFHSNIVDYNSAVPQFFESEIQPSKLQNQTIPVSKKGAEELTDRFTKERNRLERQLGQQEEAIKKFSADKTINHELGETIYTNYQRCEEILKEIKDLNNTLPPDEVFDKIANNNDVEELNLNKGHIILKVPSASDQTVLHLKLDIRKNVMENANKYYEKSKQSKEKLKGAQKALVKTQKQVSNITKRAVKPKREEPKKKIIKHFWFEKFHWLLTSRGNIVVGGRDAKSNDQVVKRHLKDKDRYCHADISGAASVVVKHTPEEDSISEDSLNEACKFAVIFSKAWSSKHGAGNAYWVKPDQVSKTPQSGEFLARGAFVIRGKRNYTGNIKLELALGEIVYQGHNKLMAGPKETLKAHSEKYVILVPGDVKKNLMANELSKLFNVSVDDILGLLPGGEFTLIEKVGFQD
jgi:predicted ribosome quality control (RQC) complex YloA/Tae2 family protein